MARTWVQDADRLVVGEVLHTRFSALPADATVGEVRAWFAESSHRRMAFLATGDRRVPVVDHDGRLLGVLSVTEDLEGFCGTS